MSVITTGHSDRSKATATENAAQYGDTSLYRCRGSADNPTLLGTTSRVERNHTDEGATAEGGLWICVSQFLEQDI